MRQMGLNEIREKYLSFFERQGHLRLPSFPLVPQGDASLLLINAGMAPLKPYFTGKEIPPSKRVTTCQKCIRTPDIERVGKTARHGTFFEMLGNFSFGDYFKREAITWAWEFVTRELELPVDKLWVSIYEDDDEAFDIWANEVGVERSRIVRMGKEDNFWEIGTGPCGPCSEIYFDRGEKFGCGSPDCSPGCDCDRFLEFWNLVFTQFDRDEEGNYNRLSHPNIDTGMGLERIAAIMQDVGSLFEVDTVKNIMNSVSKIAGIPYGKSEETDVSLRVITDHIRSTTFMISDNIAPSNEGRGYVLRRLLRRAARHGKLLGINRPFLYELSRSVVNESKEAYPELAEKSAYIEKIIHNEELRFDETIDQGLQILDGYISELKGTGKTVLDGKNAFKLYDTYGFPLDLTLEILSENGMTADEEVFKSEMEKQRAASRASRAAGEGAGWSDDVFARLDHTQATEFEGYEKHEGTGNVTAIIKNGEIVDTAVDGEDAVIILDKTVFYGESGGQKGDTGQMYGEGFKAEVYDAKKLADGKIAHFISIIEGSVGLGDSVSLKINSNLRRDTERNHSATHLLHSALHEVLGEHAAQAGSYVTPERLRFDFSHFEAMTREQLEEVESRVNRAILMAMPVTKRLMSQKEAINAGATALFGEKYGDVVRVVSMGDYSIELCGGCHVNNTSEIGLFKLLGESSVAAGVRRIEGVTGNGVLEYIKSQDGLIEKTAAALKSNPAEIGTKAESLAAECKNLQKQLAEARSKLAANAAGEILREAVKVGDVNVCVKKLSGLEPDELRAMGDTLRASLGCGIAVLASVNGDKVTFAAAASKDAVLAGVHAGNIIREVARIAGGGGGGKPDSAMAGGKQPEKADEALSAVYDLVKSQLK